MKPIYLLILSLLPAAGLQAQQGSKDRNYRTETVVRQAGITDARKADSLSITECMRKFSYYDGFGYPLQEVSVGAAKGMKDLVQHKYYDAYRRESRSYLPYADFGVAGGQFRTEAEAGTRAYYADSIRSGMAPPTFPMPRRYSSKASSTGHSNREHRERYGSPQKKETIQPDVPYAPDTEPAPHRNRMP